MSDKKLTREELAAVLEEQARALRENEISDEDVEKLAAASCCGSCTVVAPVGACFGPWDVKCIRSCVSSSPG